MVKDESQPETHNDEKRGNEFKYLPTSILIELPDLMVSSNSRKMKKSRLILARRMAATPSCLGLFLI